MISLRPYQNEGIAAVQRTWTEHPAAMLVLPTGCGKTITGLSAVVPMVEEGRRVLWLAHRRELLRQPMKDVHALWPHLVEQAGIVQADERSGVDRSLVFGSVDTLRSDRRLAEVLEHGVPDVVVWDEAHHAASDSWRSVRERLDAAGVSHHLGLTATPERADGKGLAELFELAYVYQLHVAITDGYLTPFRQVVVRLPNFDPDEVKRGADGDFQSGDLARLLLLAEVGRHTADAILEHGAGRRGLVFTCTVEQAETTAGELKARGLRAGVVHGAMDDDERSRVLQAHRAGEIAWICNCSILTEGYDDPAIDAVVVARPTRSRPLYIQQVGRGLRLAPGKTDCLIIDIAGASEEHSMVTATELLPDQPPAESDDEEREDETESSGTRNPYLGLLAARTRPVVWLRVPNVEPVAFAAGAGTGQVVLLGRGPDRWAVYHLARDAEPRRLDDRPVDVGIAMAIGETCIRETGGFAYSNKGARWRSNPSPPSDKQRAILERKRIPIPATKAEASDVLTKMFAGQALRRHRLARWSPS